MGIDHGVIFGPANNVDVAVGDYYGLGVVGEVFELLEFLDLIVLVLDVVQETVVLFYWEYW